MREHCEPAAGKGSACFTTLGIGIVRFIDNADAAPAVLNVAILPLTFISGVWFSTDNQPAWLRHVAEVFPVHALADGLQYAFNPHTTGAGINGAIRSHIGSGILKIPVIVTGRRLPAARAREIGLVNRVVPDAELDASVTALARQIAGKSPLTIAIGKQAFYRQAELDLFAAYTLTAEVMTRNMLARDAREGIDAFLEKRPPVWTGT